VNLDPSTPVLVGVGQCAERISDPGYRGLSPVELAAEAAASAIADSGGRNVAAAVDTVAGVRQFDVSIPGMPAPLGRPVNYPRAVAARIGAQPRRAIFDAVGGQSPQHLVTEIGGAIAGGEAEVALLFGSEAISTIRHFAGAADKPDFTDTVDGQLEDRGPGLRRLTPPYLLAHGLSAPIPQYALFENARRANLDMNAGAYALAMGELLAPFSEVAAKNPYAAAPTARSAQDLVTVTTRNRLVADPYTRMVVARDQVNQGAAALLMSVGAARRLGVPDSQWVFLHGHADLTERTLMQRNDLAASPAAIMAINEALKLARVEMSDIATLDLYSCFPIAVFNVCDGIGLAADDPRGLTLTGGLPFFGGAGNNYSMHAIAETVARMRAQPESFGLVGANGGAMSKYSVGVYSTRPVNWRADCSAELQRRIDGWMPAKVSEWADGWARVETYTVKRDRDGIATGIVVGRLEAGGGRFLATTADEDVLGLLTGPDPSGARFYSTSDESVNHASLRPPTT
jgi:acetyl-CoA C-acetyltransferase